jgi:OmpA-OmpF porin, OOP family
MNSTLRITLAGAALAGASMLPAVADAAAAGGFRNQGYLTDTQGNIVWALGARVCVRTSDWTPARAVAECDPDLVKKPAPKVKVKPAPKPKPKPAAKPKKPAMLNITEKIELQGMPFDKAEMTPDNHKELTKFLAALRKATKARGPVRFGAVVVTGHTDRIGTLKYNMGLSERRAVVVKDHLVKNEGVDQKLIFWEGKGPKEPIPVTKFCDNRMKRKQLIECLAPNRRVTVEIVGTAQSLAKPKPKPAAKPGAKKPASKPAR